MQEMLISPKHSSLTGHFPNNPIVPGVVILDHVMRLWQNRTNKTITQISNTKFVQLLRADIHCTISYNEAINPKKIDFQIKDVNQSIVAKGSFIYE